MISFAYGGILLFVIGCMALIDARFALVLWRAPGRAALTLAVGIAFFLIWDVVAIALGFYHRGESEAMTGLLLAPELPVEELIFITFLCYITLVLHGLMSRVLGRPARSTGDES